MRAGDMRLVGKRWNEAADTYRALLVERPGDSMALVKLLSTLVAARADAPLTEANTRALDEAFDLRFDENLELKEGVREVDPASIYFGYGLYLRMRGERERALACFTKAIQGSPGIPEYRAQAAQLAEELGLARQAAAEKRWAAKLYVRRAKALLKKDHAAAAAAALEKALAIDPKNAEANALSKRLHNPRPITPSP